jgi:hypothetical protein
MSRRPCETFCQAPREFGGFGIPSRPLVRWRERVCPLTPVPLVPPSGAFACSTSTIFGDINFQLSAMDVSARAALKGAAKCDKHCELQNSVSGQEPERILFFWDIPERMPTSVSVRHCPRKSPKRVPTVNFMPQDARACAWCS